MKTLNLLAFDLGASNGRAMLARFNGERMELSELHRFDNSFVVENGVHRWDAHGLFSHLKQGFAGKSTLLSRRNGRRNAFRLGSRAQARDVCADRHRRNEL
jgi:sugar (pentulose or hexulose) kinase